MPVYEYECNDCHKVFEVQQKMADNPLTVCPECEGDLKKLMSMSSFQLKGSGWYADGYSSSSAAGTVKSSPDSAPACAAGGGCAGCPASSGS
jgi:putative FmdB family regulatory protein